MSNTTLFFLVEEDMKLHNEFHHCQNDEELEKFMKKIEMINEISENNEIPHLDMTYEEFLKKYHCVDSEEIRNKYGI